MAFFTASTRAGVAAKAALAAGDAQSGAAGQPLGAPLSVKVTDANDNPVPGETVTFAVATGQG